MKRFPSLFRFLSTFLVAAACAAGAVAAPRHTGIPVILDTDIGDDIDDTWALGLALKSPELDLRLVVGENGRSQYRAKLLAKFLQTVSRTDVAVGVGLPLGAEDAGAEAEWVKDYDLQSYPGRVYQDGVQALIDEIMSSRQTVTVVCIGPCQTLAAALRREPRIAGRAKFVGMHGSVRLGYGGSKDVAAEWNVKAAPAECRAVFDAPWKSKTITPLDTCGLVVLDGKRYQQVLASRDRIAAAIVECYRFWSRHGGGNDPDHSSTVLYDTVAVYLAMHRDLCRMERLKIRVTDDGFTRIDPAGDTMDVATSWRSLDGYRDFLVKRLTE
jgi:inosine-uridine nucleoside N-ribohydrolase